MLLQMLKENLSLGTFLRSNRMDTLSSGYLVPWLIFIMPIISFKSDIVSVCLSGSQTVIRLLVLCPVLRREQLRLWLLLREWYFCQLIGSATKDSKGRQKGYFLCSGRKNVPAIRSSDPLFPSGPKRHARNPAS